MVNKTFKNIKNIRKNKRKKNKTIRKKSVKSNITPQTIENMYLKQKNDKKSLIENIQNALDIHIEPLNCSPSHNSKDFTCYDKNDLQIIKNMWNERNPDNKIYKTDKKDIWVELMKKMKNICDNEICWLKTQLADKNLSKKILNKTFAPISPNTWEYNPNEWLSNYDLKNVMKQYEDKYKDFSFIGPSPIDFDKTEHNKCIWNDLCLFNLKSYIDRGKNKIAIIFNTDTHDKSGSHWISLFINVNQKYIYFFDSAGDPVPNEVYILVKRILKQSKKLNLNLNFKQNFPRQHQKGGSECGMYSLYFIINLLNETVEPSFFNNNTINDNDVELFRKIYFNSHGVLKL